MVGQSIKVTDGITAYIAAAMRKTSLVIGFFRRA
jgi:hypothetical protein